jgi:hypothetical protein
MQAARVQRALGLPEDQAWALAMKAAQPPAPPQTPAATQQYGGRRLSDGETLEMRAELERIKAQRLRSAMQLLSE